MIRRAVRTGIVGLSPRSLSAWRLAGRARAVDPAPWASAPIFSSGVQRAPCAITHEVGRRRRPMLRPSAHRSTVERAGGPDVGSSRPCPARCPTARSAGRAAGQRSRWCAGCAARPPGQRAGEEPCRPQPGARASGHGLAEVVPAPSERIDAGVHTDPESTAGKRLDGAALAAGATRARTRPERSA